MMYEYQEEQTTGSDWYNEVKYLILDNSDMFVLFRVYLENAKSAKLFTL